MSGWIVETLVATSLLMLVVLALRKPVATHFGPLVAYALWLMPALRMVAPPLPEGVAETPMASLGATPLMLIDLAHGAQAQVGTSLPWGHLLLGLWIGGAALFLLWHVVIYRRFMTRALAGARELPMLDRGGIEVCASAAVPGPFAAGIFVKRVVLPADWHRRYAADELRLAMAHEEAHHQRADLSANFAALVMVALHWFNPLAHIAHRAFRCDQELACDALVLRGATTGDRHAYGAALVKSAIGRRPAVLAPLGDVQDLKRRLKMLGRVSYNGRIGAVIAAVTVATGVAVTASGSLAAEAGRSVAETTAEAVQAVAATEPAPPPVTFAPAVPAPDASPARPAAPRRVIVIEDGERTVHDFAALPAEDQARIIGARDAGLAAGEAAREAGLEARVAGAAAAGAMRQLREGRTMVIRRADGARFMTPPRIRLSRAEACPGGLRRELSGTDETRRIFVCRRDDPVDIDRSTQIAALEAARQSLAATGEPLSAEQRDAALAEIDAAIAELRAR